MTIDIETSIRRWLERKLEERGHGAQLELAAFLDVDPSIVSRMLNPYKNGKPRKITLEELVKIARFFKEPPPDFFTDVDRDFLSFFQTLEPEDKKSVLSYVEFLKASKQKQ
ncbi:XRE family transcriptional regulator [Bartonella sp. DGB2]|uniref:XRE family transcriptional regulator n=1 Tax=Bartonella sp. DGB2 TaxID=3388426 RepID=UPI00398FDB92